MIRRARLTWKVEVTTMTERRCRFAAILFSALASPWVLSGLGRKQMTWKGRFAPLQIPGASHW